ncbi:MAG: ArsR/SmtB family transcription factor [Halobacteriota archaeon]
MARLLPSSPDTSAAQDAAPRVIGLDSAEVDDLLSALSSNTARRVLATLHEEPATPSEVADRVDTSLQNVQYHLRKLDDAGLIEVVDTVYSEKGREMKVYAPADRPLVVVAGPESEQAGLKTALGRLLGGFGILALLSVIVQLALRGLPTVGMAGSASDGGGGAGVMTAETTAAATATQTLPPGLLFFLGGAAVLAVGFAVWYVRQR